MENIAYKIALTAVTFAALIVLLARLEQNTNGTSKSSRDDEGLMQDIMPWLKIVLISAIFGSFVGIPLFVDINFTTIAGGVFKSMIDFVFPSGGTFGSGTVVNVIRLGFLIAIMTITLNYFFTKKDSRTTGGSTLWHTVAPYLGPVLVMFIALSLVPSGDSTASGLDLLGLISNLLSKLLSGFFTP